MRSAVAAHTNIAELLKTLATDLDYNVREAAAANPRTASGLLAVMIHDNDNTVREAAAANPNLDPAALTGLHNGDDYAVRQGAAANPNLAPGLLSTLVASSNARHNPSQRWPLIPTPPRNCFKNSQKITTQQPTEPRPRALTPPLHNSQNCRWTPPPEIRTAAAANKATPTADLVRLLTDICPQTQTAAAATLRERHNHMRRQRPTAQQEQPALTRHHMAGTSGSHGPPVS